MLDGHQKRAIITTIREVLDEPPTQRDPIHSREDALDLLAAADRIAAERERS